MDPPLRGESFSAEHLWASPRKWPSGKRSRGSGAGDRRFIDRFESNCRFIAATYQTIIDVGSRSGSDRAGRGVAGRQLLRRPGTAPRDSRGSAARSFYLELPKLSSQPFAGFPRVYELAHELVVHTDSSLDEELIAGFISSYQQVTPLTSGEIWAVPIMLRLVLVENLRRLCGHMLASRGCRRRRAKLLDRLAVGRKRDAARSRTIPQCAALVTELIECLHDATGDHAGLGMREVLERLNSRRNCSTTASGRSSSDWPPIR